MVRARAGLKMRAECGLAGSASEAHKKKIYFFILSPKKLLFTENLVNARRGNVKKFGKFCLKAGKKIAEQRFL